MENKAMHILPLLLTMLVRLQDQFSKNSKHGMHILNVVLHILFHLRIYVILG
jgi:hypothetical protein